MYVLMKIKVIVEPKAFLLVVVSEVVLYNVRKILVFTGKYVYFSLSTLYKQDIYCK